MVSKPKQAGVYLIKHGDLYKIGCTSDRAKRLSQYRITHPNYELLKFFASNQYKELERILHRFFPSKHISSHSEWMRLDAADVAMLYGFPDEVETTELRMITELQKKVTRRAIHDINLMFRVEMILEKAQVM